MTLPREQDRAVLFAFWRILVLSVISSGLYLFYWVAVTWKHLNPEAKDDESVKQALFLLVPVYGLFRLHRIFSGIRSRVRSQDIDSPVASFSVALIVASYAAAWVGSILTEKSLALALASWTANGLLCAAAIWSVQLPLNRLWLAEHEDVTGAAYSWVEVPLVLYGLWLWLIPVLPSGY